MVESQIVFGEQNVLLITGLAKHSPELVVSALSQISGVQYFSQRDVLNRMSQDYQQRAVTMLTAGITVIFLLLLWRYRQPGRAVLALLPAVEPAGPPPAMIMSKNLLMKMDDSISQHGSYFPKAIS